MDNSDKLLEALTDLSKKKNRIPYNEFVKYTELYKKDSKLTDAEAHSLSEEFLGRIDPYENLEIVDNADKVMFTLPRINNPTKAIDNRFESEKCSFRTHANDEIPRRRSEAVQGIVTGFKESAKDPKYLDQVEARVEDFDRINKEFIESRRHAVIPADKIEAEVEASLSPTVKTEFDWDIN